MVDWAAITGIEEEDSPYTEQYRACELVRGGTYSTASRCKYCGAGGLVWHKGVNGYRLCLPETGEIHTCESYYE